MSLRALSASSRMKRGHRNVAVKPDKISSLDLRLMVANRIVDRSWRERKTYWTQQDIGTVFFDVLQELFDEPLSRLSLDDLKKWLIDAYLGARDAIPEEHRDFMIPNFVSSSDNSH